MSSSYKALKIDLSEKQVMEALKGKRIKVKPSQINTGNTFISLHPSNAKKVEKAFLTKKGFMMTLSHGELADTAQRMSGSGFFGNVWKWLKENWSVLKPVASAVADVAIPGIATYLGQPALGIAGRKLLKDTTGVGIVKPPRMTKSDKTALLRGAGIYLS